MPIRRGGKCWPSEHRPRRKAYSSSEDIVQDYIDNHRSDARMELKHFSGQPNLRAAIRMGALAINEKGKRHAHQWRIPGAMLEDFWRGLTRRRESLRSCRTFTEIMEITERVAAGIWKSSKLTVYDTAHRIGAYLGISPDRVYLHAGTKEGAKALGFGGNVPFILRAQLPKPFRRLRPYEIEDCLCRYKHDLMLLSRKRGT